jgi:hypothetical protein
MPNNRIYFSFGSEFGSLVKHISFLIIEINQSIWTLLSHRALHKALILFYRTLKNY